MFMSATQLGTIQEAYAVSETSEPYQSILSDRVLRSLLIEIDQNKYQIHAIFINTKALSALSNPI